MEPKWLRPGAVLDKSGAIFSLIIMFEKKTVPLTKVVPFQPFFWQNGSTLASGIIFFSNGATIESGTILAPVRYRFQPGGGTPYI